MRYYSMLWMVGLGFIFGNFMTGRSHEEAVKQSFFEFALLIAVTLAFGVLDLLVYSERKDNFLR